MTRCLVSAAQLGRPPSKTVCLRAGSLLVTARPRLPCSHVGFEIAIRAGGRPLRARMCRHACGAPRFCLAARLRGARRVERQPA